MADTSRGLGVDEDHRVSRSLVTRLRLLVSRPIWRLQRGMTMGSRVAIIDDDGRFLLVKHTYTPGWIFPGGGVERGESCEMAALREIDEEAQVKPLAPLLLHGIHSNHQAMAGDHLAFYILRQFERRPFKPNLEIADARFFHAQDLPQRVDGGSRRRIQELTTGARPSPDW
jgi:8-oxo-dGTP pyrophosphatase MutT (NUDIX family)